MRIPEKITDALVPLFLLGYRVAVAGLNALTPRRGYRIVRGQSYDAGPRHNLDLYIPTTPEPGTAGLPVVIFFYGGGWQSGAKEIYRFAGQGIAARGYIAVVPDYRVYPEIRYPAVLQDAAQAVRWTRDHVALFGGDPARLYLMGHSAGAYIAAMLTLDRRWLGAVGLDPRRDLRAMAGLAGPYDFLPIRSPTLQTIFGPETQWPATQPIAYADGDAPPLLLATGGKDEIVEPGNSARLAARIALRGGRVVEKVYPGLGHIQIVAALAAFCRFLAPALDDVVQFFGRHP